MTDTNAENLANSLAEGHALPMSQIEWPELQLMGALGQNLPSRKREGRLYHRRLQVSKKGGFQPRKIATRKQSRAFDSTLSKVMGKGSVIISQNITLSSVLYVPKLDCNLLSISKLTKDLKCSTKFFPNQGEFQILESGRTIDNAKECDGLYILQVETSKPKSDATSCVVVSKHK
ncbi:hypothetical protein KIW84_053362 [Lathyrus oleraceus]|uniref:Retrovirus-related Pol polyprotein from transposon TNT 1-94-like beta-barrel domain-containing protein n=1 Tax=Pisum sativum TaxID=3888 RepID=A0A9D4WUK5_PEA|nr:hypothetical protein KIW84_053362 [Pisum sativum]